MGRLRIVRAEGDAFERGRQVGAGLGELVGASLQFHRARLAGRGLVLREAESLLAPHLEAAERVLPEQVAQVRGLAAGAEVDFWELFALNALEELEPVLEAAPRPLERCSTFTAVAPGATFLAHNEQWYAGDLPSVAIVIEAPPSGPVCISPTVASYLPAVGMNSYRAAQGIDSLTALDDGVGIPRALVSHHALAAAHAADARRRADVPGRAGGYAHVLALPGGETLTIETTATRLATLAGPGAHANHYLDPALAELAPPAGAGSAGRQAQLDRLLAARRPQSAEDVMAILRDHEASPDAICLHSDAADGDESWSVLFSMICDVDAGRMWVAADNPCESPYQEVDLSDVV